MDDEAGTRRIWPILKVKLESDKLDQRATLAELESKPPRPSSPPTATWNSHA